MCTREISADEPDGYESPLYLAAKNGHKDAVRQLLDAGAFIESRDQNDNTPLMKAAEMNDDDSIVRMLIDRHAYKDARNRQGMTALNWAVRNFHLQAARYLVAIGANSTHCYSSGASTSVTVWDDADSRYANETYRDDHGHVIQGRVRSMLEVLPPRPENFSCPRADSSPL
ncbi:MAG TPA: ankyrin repeat domain-containing protein [Candidatus Angelobacter sp.]|nr:ankyrin repeat domain-containing protein [Candidatus Angelobacter sp.]